jgi:hypothetical protein
MEAELMTTHSESAKTAFGDRDVKQASREASAQEFAIKAGSIRYRNHETLTARGWLAHRTVWPKDQQSKHGVAITYGENRVLIAVAPARDRARS